MKVLLQFQAVMEFGSGVKKAVNSFMTVEGKVLNWALCEIWRLRWSFFFALFTTSWMEIEFASIHNVERRSKGFF